MKRISKHRTSAIGLGAIALAVAFGASAIAAGGAEKAAKKPKAIANVQEVTQQLQLPPQATNSGVAELNIACPGGTTLTDGGALHAPGTAVGTRIQLFESGPQGNAWHLRYDNDTTTNQLATVHAICLNDRLKVTGRIQGAKKGSAQAAAKKPKAIAGVQQVSQQLQLPPSSVSELNVSCPKGTTLLGGGPLFAPGAPLPTTNVELFESGPQGNAWHARWNNNLATTESASLTAICLRDRLNVKGRLGGGAKKGGAQAAAKKPTARTNIQQVTQQVTLPPQATNSGVAEFDVACPGGTTVVGGGALFTPGAALPTNIELFESGPRGNAWHVRFNNNEVVAQSATAHAICLRNKSNVK